MQESLRWHWKKSCWQKKASGEYPGTLLPLTIRNQNYSLIVLNVYFKYNGTVPQTAKRKSYDGDNERVFTEENGMSDLLLYLAMAVIGYFIGGRMRSKSGVQEVTGRLSTVAVILLIFTMGSRMGANREVVENLNTIGIYAFVMTIFIMAGSVLFIFLGRKLWHIDRHGNLVDAALQDTSKSEATAELEEGKSESTTWIIVICVAGGIAFGHFFSGKLFSSPETFESLAGICIDIGLCILLFFVGFDMGLDGTVFDNFKKVGLRVLAFPILIMAGTLFGAAVCALFLPVSLKEALAVGGGFGWYSCAPGIILDHGLVTASAISFMHNIMREYISLLLIPITAKKIGYLEAMALPACSSMDVCLPIVERSTNSNVAVYSFISGVIQSAAVPIVVPLILS